MLTTQVHLAPILRMRRAMPVLPLFTFYQLYATFIRKVFKLDSVSHFVDVEDAILIDQRPFGRT